jgi:hypothetical protein
VVAAVVAEMGVDVALEQADLTVIDRDQFAQGLHPEGVVAPQRHGVELGVAGHTEHVTHRGQHALFGHHRVHLGLEPGTELDQLGPIADQLAQLSDGGRGDPRLRQATQAQHVGQVSRVGDVVLHPTLAPVERLRVDQVHPGAQLLEQVHHPVVSVGPRRGVALASDPFPRPALPNRTCEFPRIRLSTSSCLVG